VLGPIDGTRNYVSGIPFWCVNLALCYREEPIVAVTFDPNHGDLFSAVKGKGTLLNGGPVRASEAKTLQASVLGVDMGYDDTREPHARFVRSLWPGMQSVRIPGAPRSAYSCCGRFGLFVHSYVYPWDLAAGILLVGRHDYRQRGAAVNIHSQGIISAGRRYMPTSATCRQLLARRDSRQEAG
jgi:myo-inositol-1(or 4)-monophosphatase